MPSRIIVITMLFIIGSIGLFIKDKIPQRFNIIASFIFALVYYYVIKFRGTAVLAVDIFLATTAANVAGNYNYRMSYRCYLFVILAYVLSIYVLKLDKHSLFKGKKRCISVAIALLSVICGFSLFI